MTDAVQKDCGRPTSERRPCKRRISSWQRACLQHETAEDRAYREGHEAGWRAAWDAQQAHVDGMRENWIAEGRRQATAEAKTAERESARRLRDAKGRQLVEVDGYAYIWPGPDDLMPGDEVLLPENWLSPVKFGPGPFKGTVTALGITYDGELSTIIRRVQP